MIIILFVLCVILCLSVLINVLMYQNLKKYVNSKNKIEQQFLLLYRWNMLKKNNKNFLAVNLNSLCSKKIAIYGCGFLGKILYNELVGTDFEVVYFVDKNKSGLYGGIKVVNPNENILDVDLIIITVVDQYFEIMEELKQKNECKIRTLEELII